MALTDNQAKFVDTYCEAVLAGVTESEAYRVAKMEAGYSENTAKRDIYTDSVTEEIRNFGNRYLTEKMPKILKKFDSLLDDPEQGGAPVLLNTINSMLDRNGIIKKESKEVIIKAPTGIVVMPGKVALDPED